MIQLSYGQSPSIFKLIKISFPLDNIPKTFLTHFDGASHIGGGRVGGLLSMPSHKSRDPLLLDREGLKQPVTTVRIKAKASQAHLSRKRK